MAEAPQGPASDSTHGGGDHAGAKAPAARRWGEGHRGGAERLGRASRLVTALRWKRSERKPCGFDPRSFRHGHDGRWTHSRRGSDGGSRTKARKGEDGAVP